MKKIILLSIISGLLLLNGCGGDDNGTDPPDPPPTVTANTTVGSPSFDNPNHAAWNSATAATINITTSIPGTAVAKAAAVASSLSVQAIVSNDSLFLRIIWSDNDYSVWKDYFEVNKADPPITFTWTADGQIEDEDHLYVMFDGGAEFGWDVWNWRSLTTAAGGLAEGFRFVNNALDVDEGVVTVAVQNLEIGFNQPLFIHEDTSSFNEPFLYFSEKLLIGDTNSFGNPVRDTHGWTIGQKIPGWYIDSTLDNSGSYYENRRSSRFDIRSTSAYDDINNRYIVVLARKLNTGFTDDLNLTDSTTVTMKIGIIDNIPAYDDTRFTEGNTNKGFTPKINLVLQP